MIVRKQTIKKTAEEVSLQLSYGVNDVKKAMQRYYFLFAEKCGNTFALNTPITELDVLHFLNHDTFACFVQKHREQLAAWAFAMALRHKFLFSSEDDTETTKTYFFSEILRHKPGRPKDYDED